jgi:D-alanine-D-alanine ligase
MMGASRVGLLFGGRSVEHEVSVTSARGVARAMGDTNLTCVPVGVTPDGRWLSPDLSRTILEGRQSAVEPDRSTDDGRRVVIDPGGRGLLEIRDDGSTGLLAVDVMFPLVHGWGGEDGRLQGAMDLAALPCVGSGVAGSAVGMDKALAKVLLAGSDIPVVPWMLATRREYATDPRTVIRRAADRLGFPLFVKPANGGSSVGISKVGEKAGLAAALEAAFEHDRRVVVEQGIDAREIECAVLGNDEPEPSGLGEIRPSGEFYDYQAKYVDDRSELIVPADLADELAIRLRRTAVRAFRALDLAGFARVDFLVERGSGGFYLNEVNTLPGFTPISMFPKLWEQDGLPFPRLIERLVQLAIERSSEQANRRTRRTEDSRRPLSG